MLSTHTLSNELSSFSLFISMLFPLLEYAYASDRIHSFSSGNFSGILIDFEGIITSEKTPKMSAVMDAMTQIFNLPETLEKIMFNSRAHETNENRGAGSTPVDILDTPEEYIFYMDVPGLSKSDIQVMVEDENTLVIRSNGKRKREDGEEEGCKYIRLERRPPQNLLRKFRLPENCNVSSIAAKCENGVLTVTVEKLPPPPKSKTVEVAIS